MLKLQDMERNGVGSRKEKPPAIKVKGASSEVRRSRIRTQVWCLLSSVVLSNLLIALRLS